jgi:two-component system, cell cycle sensor histidine kinase and response regulator CckA
MQGRSILIVEDEQIVATELREILTSLGYRIVAATATGPEALAKTEETEPDLILMDIRIKGNMDGIETASKITNRWDIPIIYLTAHADQETLRRAKVTGPMGYVLKPFSERELQIAIEMAIYKHGMERQLREQKQRLAAMLDSIGDAVIATDAEGLVTLFNPAASALTGFAEAEALGRDITTVLNIVDEATRTDIGGGVTKVAGGSSEVTTANHAFTIITKSGKVVPIDATTSHIKDEKGARRGTIIAFRDVTAQTKQTETARLMHFSINQAPDLVLQIASDGLILDVNDAVCWALGCARDDILNKHTYEVEVYSSESQWGQLWERSKRERVLTYETSYWTKDHAALPVDVRACYVRFMGREFLFTIARPISQAEGLMTGKQRTGTER